VNWLSQHSSSITALTNIGTLLVWLFYAQLLYLNFRRQRQPKIIINRGGGRSLKARCIISNMSPEAIFIEHIIAVLYTDKERYSKNLTDVEGLEECDNVKNQLVEMTRQGPMGSGSYTDIGFFEDIISRVLKAHGIPADGCRTTDGTELKAIELRIIAIYGSEDTPVGSLRKFNIKMDEQTSALIPTSWITKRYASLLQRHKVQKWIREMRD